MADFSDNSFHVDSCAVQLEGIRASAPSWGFGSQSRAQARLVYISRNHSMDVLGIDSPGPIYSQNGNHRGPKWRFGTCARQGLESGNKYPPTSNDLLKIPMPSSTEYKHQRNKRIKFGTGARTAQVNSPGFEGYIPGTLSPGPSQYTPNFFSANKAPPVYTMGAKTETGLSKYEIRPGPQAYMQPEAIGKQPNGRKPTKPIFSFGRAPRFPTKTDIAPTNPSGDDDGRKRLKFQRCANEAMAVGFGTGTRTHRAKLAMVASKEDSVHLSGQEAKLTIPNNFPKRQDILKYTEL